MKGMPSLAWAEETINEIRRHTDRPIIVRVHPRDNKLKKNQKKMTQGFQHHKDVKVSAPESKFDEDLKDCWAVVNHNSSATVGPILEGYHSFVTDPNSSHTTDVSSFDLSKIESPIEYDRVSWAERISMFHWNFDELKSGECWTHMRQYIK